MRDDRASLTAQRVALRRAAHQLLDDPLVFRDPLALAVIGADAREALAADPRQFETSAVSSYMRAFMAARSRYAEDKWGRALARGVRQYVVLGAGLDTSAYRCPPVEGPVRLFEVDHPATQAWKRARIAEAGIAIPGNLAFVDVDFTRQDFRARLADGGWRPNEATFFSWLGVTPYLERDAVLTTLRAIGALARGTEVVFDFGVPPESLPPAAQRVLAAFAARVAAAGEPFLSSFDPVDLEARLREAGFGRVEHVSGARINALYFSGRPDGLRVGSAGALMDAEVAS